MGTYLPSRKFGPSEPGGAIPLSAERPTMLDSIVSRLEEDIVLGQLHPRERLIEDELIYRFRTTRHLVRQALMELDRIGLIERVPNRGAMVRSYTTEAVEQLYELRELLESEAAQRIELPLDVEALAEIKAIQADHDLAVDRVDLSAIFRANLVFHRRLFSCCANRFLAGAIEAASQRAHGIRFFSLAMRDYRDAARREHHAMIAALEHGDRQALVQLCRDHLPASKNAYISTLAVSA